MKKIILSTYIFLNAAVSYSQTSGSSLLYGIFSAKGNTNVVLQNNGKDDLSLSAHADSNRSFGRNPFNFPKSYSNGSSYNVTVKSSSPGMTCVITEGGQGIFSSGSNRLKVDCDYSYDLISRSTNDAAFGSFYESSAPVVGGNIWEEGRYVAFVSSAKGLDGSTGKHRQVFWRDRNTGTTKMISVGPNGEEGNGDSFAPAMDINGRRVAFESYSTNLVEADANGVRDVFYFDAITGQVIRVSTGINGAEANAESFEPTFSGGGDVIAFTSSASNLTPGVEGTSTPNVYRRHLLEASPILISMDPLTHKGVGGSRPSFSGDGTRLVFYSYSSKLVSNDNNNLWDIFLYESYKPLRRISLTNNGGERNQGMESASRVVTPSISLNGRYVAFATTATNMVPDDNNNTQDVFVVDVETGAVVRASVTASGAEGDGDSPVGQGEKIAINYDGKWVAFTTKATNLGTLPDNIVMHKMTTGECRAIIAVKGSYVGVPSMSRKGSYITFGMGARLDSRFASSGIFSMYTGVAGSRFNSQNAINND